MNRFLKSVWGVSSVAVGLAGVVLCALVVVRIWPATERIGAQAYETLGHVQAVGHTVQRQGESSVALVEHARENVVLIRQTVDEFADRDQQTPSTNLALLETLDRDIVQRLEHAEEFVVAMQASIRSMSSALLMLESLPFLPRIGPAELGERDSQWRAVATALAEAADLLDQVIHTIASLRSGRAISPQQLSQLQELLAQVDQALADAETEVRSFTERVQQTNERVTTVQAHIPQWINRMNTLATALIVCFAFSQISLILHGWQSLQAALARQPSSSSSESSSRSAPGGGKSGCCQTLMPPSTRSI